MVNSTEPPWDKRHSSTARRRRRAGTARDCDDAHPRPHRRMSAAIAAEPPRRRTFAALHVRNFRLYIIGQTISQAGTWMQQIGQGWLVLRLTGSGTALGIVIACQALPVLFF